MKLSKEYVGIVIVMVFTFCPFAEQTSTVFGQEPVSESIQFTSQLTTNVSERIRKTIGDSPSLPKARLGVETTVGLSTLSVSVLDKNGRPVTGLTVNDFAVIVDGVSGAVQAVERPPQPFNVIFLLDVSTSSDDLLQVMRENAKSLLRTLPSDCLVSLATFGQRLDFRIEPTKEKNLVEKGIDEIVSASDGTSLYDVLKTLAKNSRATEPNTIVLLFSDGIDTTSRTSIGASYGSVEAAKFAIYPIFLDSYTASLGSKSSSRSASQRRRPVDPMLGGAPIFPMSRESFKAIADIGAMYLNDLASLSGGRPVPASKLQGQAPFDLGKELSSRYLLTFPSTSKYRVNQRLNLKVRISRPNLVVLTRSNFIVSK